MKNRGFTIVELLIVIVVIAILAAITVVAYNGVRNQADDAALKADLRSVGNQLQLAATDNSDVYPAGATQLTPLNLKVNKKAYGKGFMLTTYEYNLLYCRVTNNGPTKKIALVASSKSGATFTWSEGSIKEFPRSTWDQANSLQICNAVGIDQTSGSDRDIFFIQNNWMPYVN
jgi:prepilin-type N-terminal cleavage/methylation domain-containing protein